MNIDYFHSLTDAVHFAIEEDFAGRDLTAELIDNNVAVSATVICREKTVIAGRPWVDEVFRQIDPAVIVDWLVDESDEVEAGSSLFQIKGNARSLLTAERTALNFLQTLSATATQTKRYVNLISHTNAKLLDTRKTIPGLRLAQKYAVTMGGGKNHRIGLFDAFLIKENHIAAAGSISNAVQRARDLSANARIEVEVENLDEFLEAVAAQPHWIMLDNFSLDNLAQAVALNTSNSIKLEASGGIEDDEDLVKIAETGVDYISMGAITKHCKAIDLSMRFDT